MVRTTGTGAALAGLLAATAFFGCAHGERGPGSAQAAATEQAQRASREATRTERSLGEARTRLDAAQREAARADQQRAQARQQAAQADQRASQAQQRVAQEQANVQRLEAAAREQRSQAAQASARAEAAAEQAAGLRAAEGRIAQASPSRVVLDVGGGRTMAFQVDARTRVLVGAQQRSVAELQQGADARVAYDPRGAQPATAVTIDVAPATVAPAPSAAGSPQPQR